MEMTELRSKEEVKQEIEANRRDAKRALREAKTAWVSENPAVLAWKQTKLRAQDTKETVAWKAQQADCSLRLNIYKWIGIALAAGTVVGFFAVRKRKASSRVQDCCE